MSAPRILFHVQHLLGIGHWRRAVALAAAMRDRGLAVTLLAGGAPEPGLPPPSGVELRQLPPARAADARFSAIIDGDGRPIVDAFRSRRRALVLAAFAELRPHALLVESFPFGRRAFRFELLPLLEAASATRPRPAILASIRDILVAKRDPARAAETVALVRRHLDRVLVHGDPALVPLEASFPAAGEIAGRLAYTGYVAPPPGPDDGHAGAGEVVVSAGGGAVGAALLRAALAARPLSPLAAAPWRLLAGPHLAAEERAALAAALPPGVVLEGFRADFPALLTRCLLSISQAGYNTALDILRVRPRAVLVPFAAGNETEQTLRAALLAERGIVHLVREAELDGPRLAAAIAAARAAPAPPALTLRGDGAARAAEIVARLARNRNWR